MLPQEVQSAKEVLEKYLADAQSLKMAIKPDKEGWIKVVSKEEIRADILKADIFALSTALKVMEEWEKMKALILVRPDGARVIIAENVVTRIAQLEADLARMKEALEKIVNESKKYRYCDDCEMLFNIATQALRRE